MSTRDEPRDLDQRVADLDERLRRLEIDTATDPAALQFLYDVKGDILVAVADNTAGRLPVGTEGQLLTARAAAALGVQWEDPPHPPFIAKGQLLVGLGPEQQGLLDAGADGQLLVVDSTTPLGLRWQDCDCSGGGGGGGMGAMAFAVVNESTVVTDDDVQAMSDAVAQQVVDHLAPAWNALGATCTFYPGGVADVPAGAIVVHVGDLSDEPGAAGYHTMGPDDQPVAYVFAKTITDGGGGVLTAGGGFDTYCVAQVLSHEVCETFVDPKIQALADDFAAHAWIVEVGDVAALFGYLIDGVQMSDFGLPSWWDPNAGPAGPFSYTDAIPGPFSLAAGSYCFRYDTSGGTTETGARAPGEILVADPHLLPEQEPYRQVMLSSSVAIARRARGLPEPTVRAVNGRDRYWTPGS